jgi:hypothetical protein
LVSASAGAQSQRVWFNYDARQRGGGELCLRVAQLSPQAHPGGSLLDLNYGYDLVGNVKSITGIIFSGLPLSGIAL